MRARMSLKNLVGVMLLLTTAGTVMSSSPNNKPADIPKCPAEIPDEWLSPGKHPFVFCSQDELKKARESIQSTDYGKKYLESQKAIAKKFAEMTDAELKALVPGPNCKIVYGLGMNLCPKGAKLRWGGWLNPFQVIGKDNIKYPNQEYMDNGDGAKKGDKVYYFTARANGFIFEEFEERVLPALADVYVLTGDQKYAHAAAVLLDAIAATYPTNRRGPLDYPTSTSDYDRGGRLQRPYYQVARGLYNYVNTIDLLAASGEFEKPSLASKEKSIKDNIIRNLLWDGGSYCLDYALAGEQLHNGHADYLRGAGMVGIMLGERKFAEIMFNGPLSINAMLDGIDRNGFYGEVSPMYMIHTAKLYISIAELVDAAKKQGWQNILSAYENPVMALFLLEFFDRREVGGHVPMIGDDGPDRAYIPPAQRIPGKNANRFITSQLDGAWALLVRAKDDATRKRAAGLLCNTYASGNITPPNDRWSIYHIFPEHIAEISQQKATNDFFETKSGFYGAKGLALLRGGLKNQRYGAQMQLGMQNNHGQKEALTWTFFNYGVEWSFDPGYANTHLRFGWNSQSVSHQAVVVNQKSYDVKNGGGFMKAWLSDPAVQWVVAEHPDAYKDQGVKLFQRVIAQVHNPETGSLGYWLDISRVSGGEIRDDSFHAAMAGQNVNIELKSTGKFSLLGDQYKDSKFLPNCQLSGFTDKPFYWVPPGEGYGFLTNPCTAKSDTAVRAVFSKPNFEITSGNKFAGTIVVDFPAESGREYITTQSMNAPSAPSNQYLLRRDTGKDGISIFAKVVRFNEKDGKDFLESVSTIVPASTGSDVRGYLVVWKNGNSDLWMLGDNGQRREIVFQASKLPEVKTDALLALVRFDAKGQPLAAYASCGKGISVSGKEIVAGQIQASGKVRDIDLMLSPVHLNVEWNEKPDSGCAGMPLITVPPFGQPATWQIKEIAGDTVVLDDLKVQYANVRLFPVNGKPGTYRTSPAIIRFFTAGGGSSKVVAQGRMVCRSGKPVGRISDISAEGNEIQIKNKDTLYIQDVAFDAAVCETAPGDSFAIPLNLVWSKQ